MHRLPSSSTRLFCRTTRTHAYTKSPSSTSTISTQQLHTTTPNSLSTPSLFNLSALSNSRETHALSKASGLGVLNHSTALQQLDAESRAHLPAGQREDGVGNINRGAKASLKKGGGAVGEVGGRRDGLEMGAGGRLGVGVGVKARALRPPLPSIPNPSTTQQQQQPRTQHQPNAPAPIPVSTPTSASSSPPPPPPVLTESLLDSKLATLQSEQDIKLLMLGERMLAANRSWFWFTTFVVATSFLGASVLVMSYTNLPAGRDLSRIGHVLGLQSNVVDGQKKKKRSKKAKSSKSSEKSDPKGAKEPATSRAMTMRKSSEPPTNESIPTGLAWLWQAPAPAPAPTTGAKRRE